MAALTFTHNLIHIIKSGAKIFVFFVFSLPRRFLTTKFAEEALRNAEQYPSLCKLTVIKDGAATAVVAAVAADVCANPCDAGGNDDSGDNGDAFEVAREAVAAVAAAGSAGLLSFHPGSMDPHLQIESLILTLLQKRESLNTS